MKHEPIYYADYLKLNNLLNAQFPKSKDYHQESHDEMLFIVVHQVYELWFKQILHELDSVMEIFSAPTIEDKSLLKVVSRLERVKSIQRLLISQFEVLETMTPMDFLEFRDFLVPASGFQSVQFREIEIKMGLKTKNRQEIDRDFFIGRLNHDDKKRILNLEERATLLELLERWLERMPFIRTEDYNFWTEYKETIYRMLEKDKNIIEDNLASLSDKEKKIQLLNLESTQTNFETLFEKAKHQELVSLGKRTLSQRATLSALFILLYRHEPMMQQPFNILTALMDIDENFTAWRHQHSLLAHRMLGTKIGTGGSSGHKYLKAATENNRVFLDLFNLSTFLIPASDLPELPSKIKRELDFYFTAQ